MKILVMGDFHGNFSKKFNKIINKENINLVVSLGDYPPFHYRKIWFKHCYGKDVELWEIIGKKKYKKLLMKDLRMGESVLKRLNKVGIPIYTVLGNIDWPSPDDIMDLKEKMKKTMPNYYKKYNLAKKLKKYRNVHRLDYTSLRFQDYIFIGMRGHSHPGFVKSKAFKKHKNLLEKLFNKFKKENKEGKLIFVSHNIAYNTKLDKIDVKQLKKYIKKSKKGMNKVNRHYGSKMARVIINKWQPVLHLGGHIHESYGKDKLGRTILVNPGAAHEGKAAIIELINGKLKKVEFVK